MTAVLEADGDEDATTAALKQNAVAFCAADSCKLAISLAPSDEAALDPEKECESVPAPGEGCLSDCGMVSFEATVAGTVEDFDVNEWKRNIVRNTGVDCTPTSGCDLQVVVEPASVVVTTTFEFDEPADALTVASAIETLAADPALASTLLNITIEDMGNINSPAATSAACPRA